MSDTGSRVEQSKDAARPASPATKAAPDVPPVSQPAVPPAGTKSPEARLVTRRRIVWSCIGAFLGANLFMFLRFFFPRALFEPKTVFNLGYPSDFGLGVDAKFQEQYRIWVVRNSERLFVIYARCTHLGCTPDWKASENKFKCPCHGSGYDNEGINFEGPAPRPMDRAKVELDVQGRVVVDTSRLYSCPQGGQCQFDDPGAFIPV
jgi:cytochrome b6-f complex iron-sulfur subunit